MRYRIALLLLLFILGIVLLSINFPVDTLSMARELSPTPASSIPFEADKIYSVTWSPDGMTALVMTDYGDDSNAWLFRASQPWQVDLTARRLIVQGKQLNIRFSPDSQFLITSDAHYQTRFDNSYYQTRIWDTETFEQISSIRASGTIALSPDGTHLAIGQSWGEVCNCPISVYDLSNIAEPSVLINESRYMISLYHAEANGGISQLAFTSDNQRLISVSFGKLLVWDLETLEAITDLQIPSRIHDLWISSNSSRLLLAGFQHTSRGGYNWFSLYDSNQLAESENQEDALLNITSRYGYEVSPDESLLVNNTNPYTCELIDMATAQEISKLRCGRGYIHFSADGLFIYQLNEENGVWIWPVSDVLNAGSDMHILPQIYATIADVQPFIPEIIQYDLEQFAEMQP